ncbi:hypothetical protein ACFLW5_00690 [Chloroflexota bacterium]
MKCEKCGHEFKEDEKAKAFVWQGKVMCEECLFRMGESPEDAMTWAAFTHTQQDNRPPLV